MEHLLEAFGFVKLVQNAERDRRIGRQTNMQSR